MIYLASPYSHPEASFREERFAQARKFVVEMIRENLVAFSPIVYAHGLAVEYNLPKGVELWWPLNADMLRHSTELWVLKLDGWAESRGIALEINAAKLLNIPVNYVDLNHFDQADE